jgi:hypothetical protein
VKFIIASTQETLILLGSVSQKISMDLLAFGIEHEITLSIVLDW